VTPAVCGNLHATALTAANKGLQKVQLIGIHTNNERMLTYAYMALLTAIR